MTRWRCIAARALYARALMAIGETRSQFPDKPIGYIEPFPLGASCDTLGRTVAAELPKMPGQPVL